MGEGYFGVAAQPLAGQGNFVPKLNCLKDSLAVNYCHEEIEALHLKQVAGTAQLSRRVVDWNSR